MKRLTLVFLFLGLCRYACSQNISQISKSSPLIITGAVGTQNTYRYSSLGDGFSSPMSNALYANVNVNLYGISMPFSFYYANSTLDFDHPSVAFSLTPSYGNWQGFIGLSSMDFNSYVMNMSFNGVGLEYKDRNWRGGFFYGRLRNAINDDPTDPHSRSPQYKRMGWGFKTGYTDGRKYYADVYLLRAYDCLNSLDYTLCDMVKPQESLVLGVKAGYNVYDWLSVSTNLATSAFSTDMNADGLGTTTAFDKVFDTRYSTLSRFAGDISANVSLPYVNASLSYRLVQPDYTSLGTYYMMNNYESLSLSASSFLFRKVALSGSISRQSDNISGEQMYTTYGYVYNLCASSRLTDKLNVSALFNGYVQNQKDGMVDVNDAQRINRCMASYSIMPSYLFETTGLEHNIGLSLNYTENVNLNGNMVGESDVKTFAAGCSYGMDVESLAMNFTGSYSHQNTKGYSAEYTSDICSFTANRSFLSDSKLDASATLSICSNRITTGDNSFSLGLELSASYTLNKVHLFSANMGVNKYADVNSVVSGSNVKGTDLTMSLNYAYTFSLFR